MQRRGKGTRVVDCFQWGPGRNLRETFILIPSPRWSGHLRKRSGEQMGRQVAGKTQVLTNTRSPQRPPATGEARIQSSKGDNMTNRIADQSPLKAARMAGFLYLIFMVTFASSTFVQSGPIVHGDAAATARNILAHVWLFRIGVISELFSAGVLSLGGMGVVRAVEAGQQGPRPAVRPIPLGWCRYRVRQFAESFCLPAALE